LVELRPQIVGLSRSQFYFLLYFFDNMPFYVNREEYRLKIQLKEVLFFRTPCMSTIPREVHLLISYNAKNTKLCLSIETMIISYL